MRRSTMRARDGDYLVVCDRSGMTFWRSQCIKEWNGLIVYRGYSEPRHPQDFIRPPREKFGVPDARPARPIEDENFSGPRITNIADAAPAGSIGIAVNSIVGFRDGDRITLYLDNGDMFQTQIVHAPIRIDDTDLTVNAQSPEIGASATIEISTPLPLSVSAGSVVTNISNQF